MADPVTIFIPTSPIPSNPDTDIIWKTLTSVRAQLPDAAIWVLADGVRPEMEEVRPRYTEYLRRLELLLQDFTVKPRIFRALGFWHQVRMLRHAMEFVRTPLVGMVEHDCPLTNDYIPWPKIFHVLERGDVEFIRFLPEPQIHAEHAHLMQGMIYPLDLPLMKTIQFSARPHIATLTFYQRMLGTFTPSACCFLEDKFHSVVQGMSWESWKNTIYNPEGNAQRSLHLDGRAGEKKFDERQTF